MPGRLGPQLVEDLLLGRGDAGLGLGICALGVDERLALGSGGAIPRLLGAHGRLEALATAAGWLVDVDEGGAELVGEQGQRIAL